MGIKTGVWYPQMYICSLKMEEFHKKLSFFYPIVQIRDKNCSLVPPNVNLFPKNGKIALKIKFFFTRLG